MGSVLEIALYVADPRWGSLALDAAFAEATRIEALLNPFAAESELSRVNREAAQGPVTSDPELVALIRRSQTIARVTGGAFDVTVGALTRLWRDRDDRSVGALGVPPTEEAIRARRAGVGCEHVEVDQHACTVRYRTPGMEIEFGALGKGYAVDQVVRVLTNHGISRALVGFGSSTYALGCPPGEPGWRVAIQAPRAPGHTIALVRLADRAVATSGDYAQAVLIGDSRYGHIVDPRTGYPVQGTMSASVVAPTACDADAFSTAVFVLGALSGIRLLQGQVRIEGLIVSEDGRDGTIARTPGWHSIEHRTAPRQAVGRRGFFAALAAAMVSVFLLPGWGHAVVYLTRDEALRNVMPQADAIREETVPLTDAQRDQIQELLGTRIRDVASTFWIGEKDGGTVGYALVLDVIGKEQPITFMVAVGLDGAILGVEVLAYRESQGSEIRSARFMRQFLGKTLAAPLKLHRDVDAISGATLSARSTAYAVKKALALVEVVYRRGAGGSP
jgi:thiamine biosynthesis lipoprotein